MTNAEKFKEVFGKGLEESRMLSMPSSFNQIIALKSFQIEGVDCADEWKESEYQDEPTIPSGEPKLSSGFELGYEHGKADNNDKWLEWIEELESEIEGESQVEEIFDEDSFNSMNSEANSPEVAKCESYIETDIIPLHKLFAIIERRLKEIGSE